MAIAVANTGRTFRLSRGARLVRTAMLLALLISGITQVAGFIGSASASNTWFKPAPVTYVSVHAGDTLWSMAEEYAPNADPRDWIDQVTTLNNLGGAGLLAGERIAIPGK